MRNSQKQSTLWIGLTLFSMFFGAGNLIFAPYMGVQAGSDGILALLGFICTAVILPISAILVISLYGDALKMVSTINKYFAIGFITLIYLLIGPCIAIPRTVSTSFEMLSWLFDDSIVTRIAYTVIFFAACAFTAYRPGKLKDILGKVLGPILVGLILVLCIGGFLIPADVAAPANVYAGKAFLVGFTEGYQTMDILAAFCFGIVILINIRQSGITKPKEQRTTLFKAALIAGLILALIYGLLTYLGMRHSSLLQFFSNGALILSNLALWEFGGFGQVLISVIFLFACYNVCSGLLSCCAEYFFELTGRMSYTKWLILFGIAGAVINTFGLDAILAVSAPILGLICPLAILILAYGLIRYFVQKPE